MIGIFYLIISVVQVYTKSAQLNLFEPEIIIALKVISTLLVAPIHFALMMSAIYQSGGKVAQKQSLFRYFRIAPMLLFYSLILELVNHLGSAIFIIIGLYLMIATSYTIPLILDKKYRFAQAFVTSIKTVSKHWIIFVASFGLFFLMFLAGIMTLFIGFFWLAPLYYAINGVLYRDIFGLENHVNQQEVSVQDETVFLP